MVGRLRTNNGLICSEKECNQPEKSYDGKSGSIKKLAIDHCHKTGKIRSLLCWRCNGTIGKVEENITILNNMINYLKRFKNEP